MPFSVSPVIFIAVASPSFIFSRGDGTFADWIFILSVTTSLVLYAFESRMDAGYALMNSLLVSFGSVLFISSARALVPTITYLSLSLVANSSPDDLKGAIKASVCTTIFSPFMSDGENIMRFWYCLVICPDDMEVQSTLISESEISMTFVVSMDTLALVIMVPMPLTMSAWREDSDMSFSFIATREKKRSMAAPATKTKIQLNCISNPLRPLGFICIFSISIC